MSSSQGASFHHEVMLSVKRQVWSTLFKRTSLSPCVHPDNLVETRPTLPSESPAPPPLGVGVLGVYSGAH